MKKLFSSLSFVAVALGAQAQPMISSGYGTGMATINGTTYTHPGNVGTGDYQYICASKNSGFYAASFNRSKLYYVNATGTAITDSMTVKLYDVATVANDELFGVGGGDSLYRINTATKTVTSTVVVGGAWRVRERPNASELWVTATNYLYVINYTNTNSTTITLPASNYDGGGVSFTVGGTLGYTTCTNTNKLYRINAVTRAVTDSSAVIAGQYCAVVSHDSSKVFVSAPNKFRIYILNATTLALVDSINTATREPFMLYRHPTRNEVWAVNHFKDSVTVYDENTKAQIATFGIASSPHHLAFGKETTDVQETKAGVEAVKLYPNPANNELQLAFEDAKLRSVQLYDLFGRVVYTTTTNAAAAQIDVAAMVPGVYYAKITNGDKTTVVSWIKN